MSKLILIFCAFSVYSSVGIQGSRLRVLPGRLVLKTDFMRACPNVSQPSELIDFKIERSQSSNFVVNGEVRLNRGAERFQKSICKIDHCTNTSANTCRHFNTFRWYNETCRMMESDTEYWSPILRSVWPDVRCPLKAGEYYLRNGTLDLKLLEQFPFPLERYYWRVRMEAFDYAMFLCGEMGAWFMRVRN